MVQLSDPQLNILWHQIHNVYFCALFLCIFALSTNCLYRFGRLASHKFSIVLLVCLSHVMCPEGPLLSMFRLLNFRGTGDSKRLGHVYNKNQKSCGLLYRSSDQNQVVPTTGDVHLYVKGKLL